MNIEESTDIFKNIIADEVIGTYCIEIQKEGINCSENCKDEDCYLIQAIETVLNELDKDNNIISDLQNEVTLKQCELDNKDKIINLMAEQLTTPVHGIDWVIDYFTKKVKEK